MVGVQLRKVLHILEKHCQHTTGELLNCSSWLTSKCLLQVLLWFALLSILLWRFKGRTVLYTSEMTLGKLESLALISKVLTEHTVHLIAAIWTVWECICKFRSAWTKVLLPVPPFCSDVRVVTACTCLLHGEQNAQHSWVYKGCNPRFLSSTSNTIKVLENADLFLL